MVEVTAAEEAPASPPVLAPQVSDDAQAHEAAALEMEECLGLSKEVRSTIEELAKRQQQTTTRLHERKARIAQLEKEAQGLEAERDELKRKVEEFKQAYQTVRAAQKKAKEDLDSHHRELVELKMHKKDMEQLSDQYKQFKDRQSDRARGLLERMTANSDLTCMSIHFKAWKEDIEDTKRARKLQASLEATEGSLQDYMARKKAQAKKVLDRMLGDQQLGLLSVSWAAWLQAMQEIKRLQQEDARVVETQAKLARHMEEKKDQARQVLQRMVSDQEQGVLMFIISAWNGAVVAAKAAQELETSIIAADDNIAEVKKKKSEQARHVLATIATGSDLGLLFAMLTYWRKHLAEAKSRAETEVELKAQAEKLLKSMHDKKTLAKTILERGQLLGEEAVLGSYFTAWQTTIQEEKREREVQHSIDVKLRTFQQRKRDEAKAVVERMVGAKGAALMEQCFATWGKGVMELKRRKEIEAEVLAASEAETKDLEERIFMAKEDLEDVEEELAENRAKNSKLKKDFQKLQDLEKLLQDNLEDIVKE